jgi:hypothetical protein
MANLIAIVLRRTPQGQDMGAEACACSALYTTVGGGCWLSAADEALWVLRLCERAESKHAHGGTAEMMFSTQMPQCVSVLG